jgi:hypothetical protein
MTSEYNSTEVDTKMSCEAIEAKKQTNEKTRNERSNNHHAIPQ